MSTTEQFQPLHQKKQQETQFSSSVGASSLHKSMFKKPSPHQISELKNKFASPTDEMLSPCSQKLNDHRSKLFQVKSNPTKLNFQSKQLEEEFWNRKLLPDTPPPPFYPIHSFTHSHSGFLFFFPSFPILLYLYTICIENNKPHQQDVWIQSSYGWAACLATHHTSLHRNTLFFSLLF